MPMRKNLTRHGNSLALVIEKPILDLLGADADTLFEITTDGQALILSPVQSEQRSKAFQSALEQTNQKYGKALKKLAQ
jgi:antitoxin component of MazEF toxin-antitoxin module